MTFYNKKNPVELKHCEMSSSYGVFYLMKLKPQKEGNYYRGPPQAGTGLKMQTIFFSKLHCEGYIADLRYIAGSLLLEVLSAILDSTRSTVKRKIFAF